MVMVDLIHRNFPTYLLLSGLIHQQARASVMISSPSFYPALSKIYHT